MPKQKQPKMHLANNAKHKQEFLTTLANELPPFIARKEIEHFLGGMISAKYMSNIDAQGEGPEVAYAVGRNVVYRRDSLLDWLGRKYSVQRLENIKSLSAL